MFSYPIKSKIWKLLSITTRGAISKIVSFRHLWPKFPPRGSERHFLVPSHCGATGPTSGTGCRRFRCCLDRDIIALPSPSSPSSSSSASILSFWNLFAWHPSGSDRGQTWGRQKCDLKKLLRNPQCASLGWWGQSALRRNCLSFAAAVGFGFGRAFLFFRGFAYEYLDQIMNHKRWRLRDLCLRVGGGGATEA